MKKQGRTARVSMPTVDGVIDFGDGVAMVVAIPWRKGMTPLGVLTHISEKPHGIDFESTGSGPNAFVTEIDGQPNETNGQVAQYWMYYVNGLMGKVGCGRYELKPSDIVRWVYTIYDEHATL